MLFIAISGDSQPHFTTLAAFVSGMGDSVAKLFAQILLICDRQGLIGREMFAIDGVKLPSNASKDKSGTRADYQRLYPTTDIASGMNVMQINVCMPPSRIPCGTKPGHQKNPNASNRLISTWQTITHTVFAPPVSGSIAMDRIAPSMVIGR